MALAKCILTEVSGGVIHEYEPLSAVVKHEGNKKPDTFEAVFPMQNKVQENMKIAYIQDVIDVTYLRSVYPMQLSCLDESGYDQDPTTDPVETRFVNVTTNKFKGHYALDFNADAQGISITTVNKIDLSKQFDINIWFTPDQTQFVDGTDEPILWSFRNSATPRGLEIGISGNNATSSSWRVFLRVSNGSLTNGFTGANELIMNGIDQPVHIRVKRGQDNVIRAYVNGIEDITTTETASLQPTASDMIFGDTPSSTNDEYSGLIHEIKVYCGTDLEEFQADKIRWVKPIVQYMKFSGRIRKLTSTQQQNKAVCQSNSYELIKAKLGDGGIPDTSTFATAFKTIVQTAIDNAFSPISSPFNVRVLDSFIQVVDVHTLTGSIYEVGSIIDFINTLLLYADMIMYITPRRNLIIETKSTLSPSAGKVTDYIFDQNGTNVKYYIKNSENNDIKLINQAILTGRSPAANTNFNFTPTDNIRRSLRRNILTIDNTNNLNELAIKTVKDKGNFGGDRSGLSTKKYKVEIDVPIPHVRYNHVVKIKRLNGANTAAGVPANDLNEDVIVTQIASYYPSGRTIIKVGENDVDYYDDVIQTQKAEDGLVDNTL